MLNPIDLIKNKISVNIGQIKLIEFINDSLSPFEGILAETLKSNTFLIPFNLLDSRNIYNHLGLEFLLLVKMDS